MHKNGKICKRSVKMKLKNKLTISLMINILIDSLSYLVLGGLEKQQYYIKLLIQMQVFFIKKLKIFKIN